MGDKVGVSVGLEVGLFVVCPLSLGDAVGLKDGDWGNHDDTDI